MPHCMGLTYFSYNSQAASVKVSSCLVVIFMNLSCVVTCVVQPIHSVSKYPAIEYCECNNWVDCVVLAAKLKDPSWKVTNSLFSHRFQVNSVRDHWWTLLTNISHIRQVKNICTISLSIEEWERLHRHLIWAYVEKHLLEKGVCCLTGDADWSFHGKHALCGAYSTLRVYVWVGWGEGSDPPFPLASTIWHADIVFAIILTPISTLSCLPTCC